MAVLQRVRGADDDRSEAAMTPEKAIEIWTDEQRGKVGELRVADVARFRISGGERA